MRNSLIWMQKMTNTSNTDNTDQITIFKYSQPTNNNIQIQSTD